MTLNTTATASAALLSLLPSIPPSTTVTAATLSPSFTLLLITTSSSLPDSLTHSPPTSYLFSLPPSPAAPVPLGALPIPATTATFLTNTTLSLGYSTPAGPKLAFVTVHVTPTFVNGHESGRFVMQVNDTKRLTADVYQDVTNIVVQPGRCDSGTKAVLSSVSDCCRIYCVCDDWSGVGWTSCSMKCAPNSDDSVTSGGIVFSQDGGFVIVGNHILKGGSRVSVFKCGDGYKYNRLSVTKVAGSTNKCTVNLTNVGRYSDNHNVNSVMFLNEHRDHVVVGGVHGDGKIRVWEVERACTVVETFYGSEERTKGGEGISYRRVLGPPTETTVATTVQSVVLDNPWRNCCSTTGGGTTVGREKGILLTQEDGTGRFLGFGGAGDGSRRRVVGGVAFWTLEEAMEAEHLLLMNEGGIVKLWAEERGGGMFSTRLVDRAGNLTTIQMHAEGAVEQIAVGDEEEAAYEMEAAEEVLVGVEAADSQSVEAADSVTSDITEDEESQQLSIDAVDVSNIEEPQQLSMEVVDVSNIEEPQQHSTEAVDVSNISAEEGDITTSNTSSAHASNLSSDTAPAGHMHVILDPEKAELKRKQVLLERQVSEMRLEMLNMQKVMVKLIGVAKTQAALN